MKETDWLFSKDKANHFVKSGRFWVVPTPPFPENLRETVVPGGGTATFPTRPRNVP